MMRVIPALLLFLVVWSDVAAGQGAGQDLTERAAAWRMVMAPLRREIIDDGVEFFAPEEEWEILRDLVVEVISGTREAFPGPMEAAPEFRVVILSRVEQFAMITDLRTAEVLGAGVRGVTLARTVFVLSPSAEAAGYDWQRVLAHELLHLLARSLSSAPLPVWFDEGLAWSLDDLWRAGPIRRPGPVDMGLLALAVRGRKLVGWDRLKESFGQTEDPRAVRLAFTQAALAVRVILDRGGVEDLWAICRGVGDGRDFGAVLAEVSGYKLDRLQMRSETVWGRGGTRAEMNAARIIFELQTGPEGMAATDRMHLADLLWGRGRKAAALDILKGIDNEGLRRTAAWALRAGRLHLALGRAQQALDIVDTALELQCDDGQLLLVRALAYETLGREAEARAVMASVYRLQPFALDVCAHLQRLEGGQDEQDR